MRGKPTINYAQEAVLAYCSASAPHGTEFGLNVRQTAIDLGYKDRRNVYYALQRLREVGAVTLVLCGKHWRHTTLICHMREEDCNVVGKMPGSRKSRRWRDQQSAKPLNVAPVVNVAPPRRKLIAYVGKGHAL